MATYTGNYNLKKPVPNENYNVEDQNENMDKIDKAVNDLVSGVTTVNKATNATKVNGIEITKDENDVLNFKGSIIKQTKILWESNGEYFFSQSSPLSINLGNGFKLINNTSKISLALSFETKQEDIGGIIVFMESDIVHVDNYIMNNAVSRFVIPYYNPTSNEICIGYIEVVYTKSSNTVQFSNCIIRTLNTSGVDGTRRCYVHKIEQIY